jgi:hypothetical protein
VFSMTFKSALKKGTSLHLFKSDHTSDYYDDTPNVVDGSWEKSKYRLL